MLTLFLVLVVLWLLRWTWQEYLGYLTLKLIRKDMDELTSSEQFLNHMVPNASALHPTVEYVNDMLPTVEAFAFYADIVSKREIRAYMLFVLIVLGFAFL